MKERNLLKMYFFIILSILITSSVFSSSVYSSGFKFVSESPGKKTKTQMIIKTSPPQSKTIIVTRVFGNDGIEKVSVNPSVEVLKSALKDKDEDVRLKAENAIEDIDSVNKKKAASTK